MHATSRHSLFVSGIAIASLLGMLLSGKAIAATTGEEIHGWSVQAFAPETRMGDVDMKDGIGYGVAGRNVYKTIDDGRTWSIVATATSDETTIVAVAEIGASTAVGLASGTVLRTSDGGVTWLPLETEVEGQWNSIVMNADGTGVAMSLTETQTVLYRVTNVGQTFTEVMRYDHVHPQGLYNDGSTVWAVMYECVGLLPCLIRSTDAGISWRQIAIDEGAYWITGIAFSGEQGWMIGYNALGPNNAGGYYETFVWRTENGGTDWTLMSSQETDAALIDIVVQEDGSIVALAETIHNWYMMGTWYRSFVVSNDSGATWTTMPAFADQGQLYSYTQTFLENFDGTLVAWGVTDLAAGIFRYNADLAPLVKLTCQTADVNDPCRAVYYVTADGKRHAFPNEKTYFTWFDGFGDVTEVSADYMASLPLGANVTYHPGMKMVKFMTSPKVYVVTAGGVLRAVADEAIAAELYGANWNTQIDDISDAFFGNYSFGAPIEASGDVHLIAVRGSVQSLAENF